MFMPFTTDITTINVVVAMTTPSSVRNDRSLWVRSSSSASQKAWRAGTQKPGCTLSFDRIGSASVRLSVDMLMVFRA